MTTATASLATSITRFKHYDDDTNDIYVGEIFADCEGQITILSCWLFSTVVEEVYPYEKGFPYSLRAAIEQTAIEQRFSPPAVPIEIPDDWNAITVEHTETTYEIKTCLPLPTIASDYFRAAFGLKAVQRITPTAHNGYRITVRGCFADMMRELKRAAAELMQDGDHAAQEREETALIHI